jgi:hypothetical protein
MEALVSHLVMVALGAGVVWYLDRPVRRQFKMMLDALDEGKVQGKDWKLVHDATGNPTGFRVMLGASGAQDDPKSV